MRKENVLKKKLKDGDSVFGMWCVLPSAAVTNVIAAAGMDFVIIDMEHGPIGIETAEEMARAADSETCCPIIRLGQKDEGMILKSLDIGAHGILVAHVENRQDAADVISFSKYQPIGKRGFSPYTRAGGYGTSGIERHAQKENEQTLAGVILEGTAGIENIDSILETEHLDLVYIGAYDLSQSLGMPGQVKHPLVKSHMEKAIRKIRDAGIAAGGYVAKDAQDIRWMIDMGMQFITCLPDVAIMFDACSACTQNFKSIINLKE